MPPSTKLPPGPPPDLFTNEEVVDPPAQFAAQAIAKRHRFVRLNVGVITALEKRGRIRLNLFPDLSLTAAITASDTQWFGAESGRPVPSSKASKAANNTGPSPHEQLVIKISAHGQLLDDPDSLVALTLNDRKLTGTVTLPPDRQFIISHLGAGVHVVVETKPVTPKGD